MTIERCRQILGEKASALSDDEVAALIAQYDSLAEVSIDLYLQELKNNE